MGSNSPSPQGSPRPGLQGSPRQGLSLKKYLAPPVPPQGAGSNGTLSTDSGKLQVPYSDYARWSESSDGESGRSRSPSPNSHRHHHRHRRHSREAFEKKIEDALEKARLSGSDMDSEVEKDDHWKMDPNFVRHKGGCHCGAVRFEVFASPTPKVIDCNCSICVKKQMRHFIVPLNSFKLLKGHDALTTYTFNTHKAKHTFCSVCGVQSFYIPRSNSDGYGIIVSCLDEGTMKKEKVEKFDGKHWEEEIKKKPHILNYSKVKV